MLRGNVIGHTDSMGAAGYNMGLSERRAAAVASYLSGKGISRGMLSSKGMGESDPVASNDNAEGRMMNRRVVFEIAR
ncbi:OmpA family protein [Candidatus Reidiella endopervernicosa]|uniref:OmpA family protein n=1 Tax=Candidatus Reidiella endopervernicosa TaxID=2738883 RepID=A0A6N0I0H1_9GAMM|nr:OmpA family protein [Candidatus Reidiella endopervernicosa]QKQ28083.1 OmpA family protein [Candidatus Reidiella endopervernicosa]